MPLISGSGTKKKKKLPPPAWQAEVSAWTPGAKRAYANRYGQPRPQVDYRGQYDAMRSRGFNRDAGYVGPYSERVQALRAQYQYNPTQFGMGTQQESPLGAFLPGPVRRRASQQRQRQTRYGPTVAPRQSAAPQQSQIDVMRNRGYRRGAGRLDRQFNPQTEPIVRLTTGAPTYSPSPYTPFSMPALENQRGFPYYQGWPGMLPPPEDAGYGGYGGYGFGSRYRGWGRRGYGGYSGTPDWWAAMMGLGTWNIR